MKAKDVSLWVIVFAVAWIMFLSLIRGFAPVLFGGKEFGLNVLEIIGTGVAFVALCTPVYRSIWLDKQLGISSGEKVE